jgi:2'-5' RNA ligase
VARLFVAAWLPDDVAEGIAALPRPAEPGVRWVPRDQWHVTLRFFGEADRAAAADALVGLGSGPVEAVVGPAVSRLGRRVLCLPVHGLDQLAEELAVRTGGVGQPPDPRPFNGHITLARLDRRGSCRLAGRRFAARFPVAEVALVRSVTGPEGPTYLTEVRVPLGA